MFAKTLASVGLKLLERLSFYCQSETKNWDHLMRRFIDCSEETKSVWNQWVILVFITESYKALLSVFLSSGFQDFFLGWLTVKKKTKQIPSPSRPRSYISIHSLNKQVLATYYMPKTKQNTVVNKEEGREGNKSSPQRSYILVQQTKQAKHTHTHGNRRLMKQNLLLPHAMHSHAIFSKKEKKCWSHPIKVIKLASQFSNRLKPALGKILV